MFDASATDPLCLRNARIVTPEGVLHGGLVMERGQIAEVSERPPEGLDCEGDYLVPGVVDVHTDHAETHVFPRSGVVWDFLNALMAHDGVVISGGTTTVFDSLSVGASMTRPERRNLLVPLVEALERGRELGMFRADHLLHLRCEISDPATQGLVDATIDRGLTRLVSVMDHTPGDRQSPDVGRWVSETARDLQVSLQDMQEKLAELVERTARVGPGVRAHVIGRARTAGLTVMSHDDRTPQQVDEALAAGVTVSEFPVTFAAAEQARARGMQIVAGAPNLLRGGSQSGNIAVRDLLQRGLVDVLASDYVPRSPLDAAFAIAADPGLPQDLPRAIAMVSRAPALLAGLVDRGALTPGLRGDLVRVSVQGRHLHVRGVWRAGVRVA